MKAISHHVPDAMLAAYAAGSLPYPFALVIASHVSLCIECRAALEAHQGIGGALLESAETMAVSDGLKADILARLDAPYTPEPVHRRKGALPGPVMSALKGREPRWKSLGMGYVRTSCMRARRVRCGCCISRPDRRCPITVTTGWN